MAIANLGNLEMKKVLLGTSALLGVGLLAGTAAASDGVKLSLGGFMRSYYGMTFDDDSDGDLGHDHGFDGVGTDGEVYFLGSVTLDNGITVGTRIELEAENDEDQIDAAYVYFKGGFGDIRIGSLDGAASAMYMLPPGSSANFGPYSPNTTGSLLSPGVFDPSSVGKAQKIVYYSPTWSGFNFGLSYTPNGENEDYTGPFPDSADTGFHHSRTDGNVNHEAQLGLHYDFEGDGWGLALGGAFTYSGDVEEHGDESVTGYNAGANVNFGGLTVGAAFTYVDTGVADDSDDEHDLDFWTVGTGLSYNVDAWTVGAGWAHAEFDEQGVGDSKTDRVGVTGQYDMGPGIALDAGIFYTWGQSDADEAVDDYDSIEFSVGSSISF